MSNDKTTRVIGPTRTEDGHKPGFAKDGYSGRGHQPGEVNNGYQSPGGASRPPLPTVGSAVKPGPTSKKD